MSNMEIVQELFQRIKNHEEAKEAYGYYESLYKMDVFEIGTTLEKWQKEGNNIALKESVYRIICRALDQWEDGLISKSTFSDKLVTSIEEVESKLHSTQRAMKKAQEAFEETFKTFMVEKEHVISYEEYLKLIPALEKFLQS